MAPRATMTHQLEAGRGYPRPQPRRRETALNGEWDFALDPAGGVQKPDEVRWTRRVRVPFSPAAPLSRVRETGFFRACWRPGGRLLVLEEHARTDMPIVLSEFGGIHFSTDPMSGFCYTPFADTCQEANRLVFADRRPKFLIEEIARATRGAHGGEPPVHVGPLEAVGLVDTAE